MPIGFLLLAVLLEFWPGDAVRKAITVSWVLGASSALAAAGAGWLLASEGGYGGDTLFWHRWAGVSVAALAIIGCYVQYFGGLVAKAYGLLTAAALTLAGHQGGNLTHGEEYLFKYAPPVVQRIAGHAPDSVLSMDWEAMDMDSIQIFANFLRPVLDDKCVRCHNAEKQNGGLRMDANHFLFAGGESGPLLVAGDPVKSRWVNRVTLPETNVKAMPPQGERMTFTEVRLLEYWISLGADTLAHLNIQEVPEELKALLLRDFGLHLRPRQFVETVKTTPLDKKTRAGLSSLNWNIIDLVPGGAAIEVKPRPGTELASGALSELAAAAPTQVTSIGLDDQDLGDDQLAVLAEFSNLNRLRLNGTKVTALTISRLAGLEHLESLNLYNTSVGDEILVELAKFPALNKLYLWQSGVTTAAAETFAESNPRVNVNTGILSDTDEQTSKK